MHAGFIIFWKSCRYLLFALTKGGCTNKVGAERSISRLFEFFTAYLSILINLSPDTIFSIGGTNVNRFR